MKKMTETDSPIFSLLVLEEAWSTDEYGLS